MLQNKMPFILIILLLMSNFIFIIGVLGASDGQTELDDAELRFTSALRAVQTAEKNGINVQSHVDMLKYSLLKLKEAKELKTSGNVTQAISTAQTVSTVSIQIEDNLASYTSLAYEREGANFQLAVIYSSIAAIISVSAIYFGWMFFKRWYLIKVLDMKPEVTSNES